MELNQLKTWDDLESYLLERMDYADESQSEANSNFTKVQHWNSLMAQCMKWEGELPVRTKSILLKNVKRDFGMSAG